MSSPTESHRESNVHAPCFEFPAPASKLLELSSKLPCVRARASGAALRIILDIEASVPQWGNASLLQVVKTLLRRRIEENLAHHTTATALRRERLMRFQDRMTGLRNHHYWQLKTRREYARCARESAGAGILLFDLDYLSEANRTSRELADLQLATMAVVLKQQCDAEWTVVRFLSERADEMAVLIPDMVSEETIESTGFRIQQKTAAQSVSVSFGYAVLDKHGSPATAMSNANRLLFVNKDQRKADGEAFVFVKGDAPRKNGRQDDDVCPQ